MAIDNRLQVFNEEGQSVDYDIMATDVKFADGKDLPTKLDELEDEIGESQGGYTPPQGGIPKTDLAPAVQQTLDDVANKVDKVTGKGLSSNDYTDTDKAKVDGLKPVATSGSYNDLTDKPTIPTVPTMDAAPTAGNTSHTVSSDGVASALNNLLQNLRIVNGEWYIGNTATGVSAQGPAGNVSITDASQLVTILVNDLTTGGGGNILSAEMGKVLKTAVQTLIDSMGEYCFPNGRPTLSFEAPKWKVTQNLTNVDSDFSALRIDKGGELTIHLTAQYGYVLGAVTVVMGNVDITSTAYSAGVVHIAQVTGDVVVTASVQDYVSDRLVFHLDGIDKGNNSGSWTDLVGGVVFTNHGATSVASGWDFDGSAYMESSNPLSGMSIFDGTLEVCFTSRLTGQSYFVFVAGGSNLEMVFAPDAMTDGIYGGSDGKFDTYIFTQLSGEGEQLAIRASSPNTDNGIGAKIVSLAGNATTGILNGLSKSIGVTFFSADSVTRIGNRQKNGVNEKFFTGIIHSIRYYDRYLSDEEILQNQKLDNARFNLGLTIN